MRFFNLVLLVTLSTLVNAQDSNYNLEDGYVAKGYDVVAYFDNSAVEGKNEFTVNHNGLKLKFSNQENLNTFNINPDQYLPQYGGWCAYAIGVSGDKVNINPKAFEIRDNKLYLFYKTFLVNTLKKWKKGDPKKLKIQADKNWGEIILKN